MKKIAFLAFGLAFSFNAFAASIVEDIAAQGKQSYLSKTITNQQLADMIRDNEDVTAANTLTYSECGKTIFLNSATEFATTLPSPVAGCYFKFIVKAAPVGANYTIVTSGGADILIGGVNELEVDTSDDGPYDDNADVITFIASTALVGDYVEMISDGTSWYFVGQTNADGGITTGTT